MISISSIAVRTAIHMLLVLKPNLAINFYNNALFITAKQRHYKPIRNFLHHGRKITHTTNKRVDIIALTGEKTSISSSTYTSSSSLPWVQSLESTNDTSHNNNDDRSSISSKKKQLSIFSWNILAQYLFDAARSKWYNHILQKSVIHNNNDNENQQQEEILLFTYDWYHRWKMIQKELQQQSKCDIICLQEVEYKMYELDILPFMIHLGFDGIIQKSTQQHGIATFWRKSRFTLCNRSDRSRTLITTLKDHIDDNNTEIIAIINCHLQGNPTQAVARVNQLQHSIKDLQSAKFTIDEHKNNYHRRCDNVIICGDFNSQLGNSASSLYLRYGSCPEDIPMYEFIGSEDLIDDEQKRKIKQTMKPHGYNFHSAYPFDLVRTDSEDSLNYITFANKPGHYTVGLDQIWFHSSPSTDDETSQNQTVRVVGLKHPFHSEEHRNQVIQYGLPSPFHPSDHMSVGCILEWEVEQGKIDTLN